MSSGLKNRASMKGMRDIRVRPLAKLGCWPGALRPLNMELAVGLKENGLAAV